MPSWTISHSGASFSFASNLSSGEGLEGRAMKVLVDGGLGKLKRQVLLFFLHDFEWFLECIWSEVTISCNSGTRSLVTHRICVCR